MINKKILLHHFPFQRFFSYILGLFITAIGSNLFINAALGVAPSCTFALTLTYLFSFGSYAVYNFMTNLCLLIGEILISKECGKTQLTQLFLIFLYSFFIQSSSSLVSFIHSDILGVQILISILACFVMSLGVSFTITSRFAVLPTEGFINSIAQKINKPFGTVRICVEVIFTSLAAIISLLFLHDLRSIGIGTVISALMSGMITNLLLQFVFSSSR